MRSKFKSIVSSNRFNHTFVWPKQVNDGFCQFISILAMFQFSHKQQVGAAFCKSNNSSMITLSYDSIHFEVSEAFPVSFYRPFTNAYSIWDSLPLTSNRSGTMLLPMTAVLVQFSAMPFITSNDTINAFMRDKYLIFSKMS